MFVQRGDVSHMRVDAAEDDPEGSRTTGQDLPSKQFDVSMMYTHHVHRSRIVRCMGAPPARNGGREPYRLNACGACYQHALYHTRFLPLFLFVAMLAHPLSCCVYCRVWTMTSATMSRTRGRSGVTGSG